jgi:hypothetical protein
MPLAQVYMLLARVHVMLQSVLSHSWLPHLDADEEMCQHMQLAQACISHVACTCAGHAVIYAFTELGVTCKLAGTVSKGAKRNCIMLLVHSSSYRVCLQRVLVGSWS